MVDYGYYFSLQLHKKLKSKIKGRIYIGVNDDDVLFIEIKADACDSLFKITFENFSRRILNGWTSDYAAYEVMREFKHAVMEQYFY